MPPLASLIQPALEAVREGNLNALAASPLAHSPLVQACFLPGEQPTPDARAWALQAVLHWAVERLRPGAHNPNKISNANWVSNANTNAARLYHSLHLYYFQALPIQQLSHQLNLALKSLYKDRANALALLAQLLQAELDHPHATAERQQAYLADRYARLPTPAQTLLRATAIFTTPVPPTLPATLAALPHPQDLWPTLSAAGWITLTTAPLTITLAPHARPFLLLQLAPAEHTAWHTAAAQHFAAQRAHWFAVDHWRAAGKSDAAVDWLVKAENAPDILLQPDQLRARLDTWPSSEVSPEAWARLRILAGQLAEAARDLPTALNEYAQAMGSARTPALKAQAAYHRARALRAQDITQVLAHYQQCITLLAPLQPHPPLWWLAWLGIALFYMDEHLDLPRARAALDQLEPLAAHAPPEVQPRLYHALGEWHYHQKQLDQALAHHHRAWAAALATQDIEMQLNSAYNLGSIYGEAGRPQQGLSYLQQGLNLARQIGNRRLEALCHKGLGEYHYWQHNDVEAVRAYRQAHSIFVDMDNRNSQAVLCYDLAEALARQGEWDSARHYFAQGHTHAQTLGIDRFLKGFAQLARRYPRLSGPPLTPHQTRILALAQHTPTLTSAHCAHACGISQRQAARELTQLVKRGLLTRAGTNRDTTYHLPAREGEKSEKSGK